MLPPSHLMKFSFNDNHFKITLARFGHLSLTCYVFSLRLDRWSEVLQALVNELSSSPMGKVSFGGTARVT